MVALKLVDALTVTLYIALYLGKNYILHTASDYAKIEQISAQRWKYYLSARRFF